MTTASLTVRMSTTLATLIVAGAAASAGVFTFEDSTFNAGDWSLRTLTTGNGGTVTATTSAIGRPAESREVRIDNNGGGSSVVGLHMGNAPAATFDSGRQSISSIDFRFDAHSISGTNAAGHFIGMAINQGGIDYVTANARGSFQLEGWRTSRFTFTAASFRRADGLAGGPDFSPTGAAINFGFFTSINTGSQSGAVNHTARYDNLRVTFNTVPTPGAAVVAALGGLLIARRRRGG